MVLVSGLMRLLHSFSVIFPYHKQMHVCQMGFEGKGTENIYEFLLNVKNEHEHVIKKISIFLLVVQYFLRGKNPLSSLLTTVQYCFF